MAVVDRSIVSTFALFAAWGVMLIHVYSQSFATFLRLASLRVMLIDARPVNTLRTPRHLRMPFAGA